MFASNKLITLPGSAFIPRAQALNIAQLGMFELLSKQVMTMVWTATGVNSLSSLVGAYFLSLNFQVRLKPPHTGRNTQSLIFQCFVIQTNTTW